MKILIALSLAASLLAPAAGAEVTAAQRADALRHYRAGEALAGREDLAAAEGEYRAALQIDPLLALAHYALGQGFLRQKRYPDAVTELRAAKDVAKQLGALEANDRATANQRRDEEIQELRSSIQSIQSGQNHSASATEVPRYEQRIQDLQNEKSRPMGTSGVPAEFSLALGSALLRTGALAEAGKEYEDAVKARPDLGEAHNNLAVVYMGLGRWDEATAEVALAEKGRYAVSPKLKADLAARRSPLSAAAAPAAQAGLAAQPAEALRIEGPAVECVVARWTPRVEATIRPADRVSRARLRFRTDDAGDWYSVGMSREEDTFVAVMPRAKRDLPSFRYYVEVTDDAAGITRGPERTMRVVADAARCKPGAAAAITTFTPLVRDAPAGGPAVPRGFEEPTVATATGDQKIGVFNLNPAVALGAGLAVGAAAYLGLNKTSDVPDLPPIGGIEVLSASPAPGSTIQVLHDPIDIRVRVTSIRTFDGRVSAQFFQGDVMCGLVNAPEARFGPDAPVDVTISGPVLKTNECPASTTHLVVAAGFSFQTGKGGIRDTGLDYTLVP